MATTYTAANLQTINNYSGMTNADIELFMDGIISHINVETGATLPHFRDDTVNASGSKEVSLTDAQEPAFLAGAALMLRAYNDKGPNLQAGPVGVTAIVSDPHYKIWASIFTDAKRRLRNASPPIYLSEDPVPTE